MEDLVPLSAWVLVLGLSLFVMYARLVRSAPSEGPSAYVGAAVVLVAVLFGGHGVVRVALSNTDNGNGDADGYFLVGVLATGTLSGLDWLYRSFEWCRWTAGRRPTLPMLLMFASLCGLAFSYASFDPPDGFWQIMVREGETFNEDLVNSVGRNLYGTLGVEPTATRTEILQAYGSLTERYRQLEALGEDDERLHDESEELEWERENTMESANFAYNLLKDDALRRDYDALRERYRWQKVPRVLFVGVQRVGKWPTLFFCTLAITNACVVLNWTLGTILGSRHRWKYPLLLGCWFLGQMLVRRYVLYIPTELRNPFQPNALGLTTVFALGSFALFVASAVLRAWLFDKRSELPRIGWVSAATFIAMMAFLGTNAFTGDVFLSDPTVVEIGHEKWVFGIQLVGSYAYKRIWLRPHEFFALERVAQGVSRIILWGVNVLFSDALTVQGMLTWTTQLAIDDAPSAPESKIKTAIAHAVKKTQIYADSEYFPAYLSKEEADELLRFCDAQNPKLYGYRASVLKRAPKKEWYLGERVVYRWGQHKSEYESGEPMPPVLRKLAERLTDEFGEKVNHDIMIKYSDGVEHHAPAHKDKQQGVEQGGAKDMVEGTSFFVLSLGDPRLFEIVDLNESGEVSAKIFSEHTAHGSLLKVGFLTNKRYWHQLPKEAGWNGRVRYSLIFRVIKPMESEKPGLVSSAIESVLPTAKSVVRKVTGGSSVTLAHAYDPEKHEATVKGGGWTLSEKFDGVRFWVDTDTGEIRSRNDKAFAVPAPVKESLLEFNLKLDGEMWIPRDFPKTLSIVRKTTNVDPEEWERIRFMIFDFIPEDPMKQANYALRQALLKRTYEELKKSNFYASIHLVPQFPITSATDIDKTLDDMVANGAEGLMLRNNDTPYEFKRSHNLLKVKRFKTKEARVVSHHDGKGRHAGRLGKLTVETLDTGVKFDVGTGMSDAQREDPSFCPPGAIVTVKYFEETARGACRFPVFVSVRDYE